MAAALRSFFRVAALSCAPALVGVSAAEKVNFNYQVRPILSANCLRCHGMDEKLRKGKLRLDDRESAVTSGAITPGKPEESTLLERLHSSDPEEVMPPPETRRTLSEKEKQILHDWIAQGAEYQTHWAFIPPVKPVPPVLKSGSSAPIDAFVREELEKQNLMPAPAAEKHRWLRRATLDLTGLPPTVEEVRAFDQDASPQAFERVVERLLKSPAYGEHQATAWLDAVRYADTFGRHEDAPSSVWPYRDWVVDAFNNNLPYDQFLLWQTAGDMLPKPTREQVIATAFNRLVQQSNEAGSNEDEFRQEHVADRVRTNATAILGLTLECARCHDHKYDPLSTRDYYSFSAFLNNINELGLYPRQTAGVPAPSMLLMEPEAQKRSDDLLRRIAEMESTQQKIRAGAWPRFASHYKKNGAPAPAAPIGHWDFERDNKKKKLLKEFINRVKPDPKPALARQTPEIVEGHLGEAVFMQGDFPVTFEDVGQFRRGDSFSFALWFKPGAEQQRTVLLHRTRGGLDAASRGYEIILDHMRPEFSLSNFAPANSIRIRAITALPVGKWTHLVAAYDGSSRAAGLKIYINGIAAVCEVISDHLYRDISYRKEWGDFDESKIQDNGTPVVHLEMGWRYNDMGVKDGTFDELKLYDRALSPVEARLLAADGPVESDPGEWFPVYLRDHDEAWRRSEAELHRLRTEQDDLANAAGEIMVMREMQPRRRTHILLRGSFDQKGAEVGPDTPASILPFPPELSRDRLGLARWFVDRRNPLTARVFVNRVWQSFFGQGLVITSEDFGVQCEPPSHPKLLDWLACEFMDRGWDVKWLCREIVLSETYRQSSMPVDGNLLKDDPQNRLLARGPRHRLSAEQVRDLALAVSGLLVSKRGGPPVKPYQPENLYEDSGVQEHYEQDHGEALWRRSIYALKKRTMPLPNMTVFDAPTREFCKSRRERTSTPLQALTLLNDPQFVEACRVLAQRLVKAWPHDDGARLKDAFMRLTSRAPSEAETAALLDILRMERAYFQKQPQEAAALVKNGEAPGDDALPPVEVAAMTAVLRVLLSDDETLINQ